MTEFVVGERRFRLEPMTIDEAEVIYPNVMRIGVPVVEAMVDFEDIVKRVKRSAVASAEGDETEEASAEGDETEEASAPGLDIDPELLNKIIAHVGKIANATVEVPVIRKAFMRKCKVLLPSAKGNKKENWVPLEMFFDETFQRKHGLMLRWLATCVMTEFASFLDEIVHSLG